MVSGTCSRQERGGIAQCLIPKYRSDFFLSIIVVFFQPTTNMLAMSGLQFPLSFGLLPAMKRVIWWPVMDETCQREKEKKKSTRVQPYCQYTEMGRPWLCFPRNPRSPRNVRLLTQYVEQLQDTFLLRHTRRISLHIYSFVVTKTCGATSIRERLMALAHAAPSRCFVRSLLQLLARHRND